MIFHQQPNTLEREPMSVVDNWYSGMGWLFTSKVLHVCGCDHVHVCMSCAPRIRKMFQGWGGLKDSQK